MFSVLLTAPYCMAAGMSDKCTMCKQSLRSIACMFSQAACRVLLFTAAAGMLDKYGVELIGAKLPSIDRAEDRELFKQAMKRIGLKTPPRYTMSWLRCATDAD